jgi:hypothetical protein
VWKEVVAARYGRDVIGKRLLGLVDIPRLSSSWWKSICSLDGENRWFSGAVRKKVGRGNSTVFWEEQWIGDQPLRQKFPRLFGISTQKEEVLCNMGILIEGRWHWNLQWRRDRFQWEEEQFREFSEIILPFNPVDVDDNWMWCGDGITGFTVKGAYLLLEKMVTQRRQLEPIEEFVFKRLWKCLAPSKVCAFSWQLILGRVQTKDNLFRRRLIPEEQLMCVVCGRCIETSVHLFLHCNGVARIWNEITRWLGLCLIIPPTMAISFAMWVSCSSSKKVKQGICLIWYAYVWVLWKARNAFLFKNKAFIVEEVVEDIKRLSWQWFIGRMAKSPCLLYEWIWNPIDCMRN